MIRCSLSPFCDSNQKGTELAHQDQAFYDKNLVVVCSSSLRWFGILVINRQSKAVGEIQPLGLKNVERKTATNRE
jgi:hypothetical protein